MVHSAVQRHGGSLDLRSAPGVGTTFVFTFPLRPAVLETPREFSVAKLDVPLRILAVDDQPVLCEILRRVPDR